MDVENEHDDNRNDNEPNLPKNKNRQKHVKQLYVMLQLARFKVIRIHNE